MKKYEKNDEQAIPNEDMKKSTLTFFPQKQEMENGSKPAEMEKVSPKAIGQALINAALANTETAVKTFCSKKQMQAVTSADADAAFKAAAHKGNLAIIKLIYETQRVSQEGIGAALLAAREKAKSEYFDNGSKLYLLYSVNYIKIIEFLCTLKNLQANQSALNATLQWAVTQTVDVSSRREEQEKAILTIVQAICTVESPNRPTIEMIDHALVSASEERNWIIATFLSGIERPALTKEADKCLTASDMLSIPNNKGNVQETTQSNETANVQALGMRN